jgi:ribonuclease P protein component
MSVEPSNRRGLGRRSRIKQGRDFMKLRLAGRRAVKGCMIANWLQLPGADRSRVGVVVSRKVGGAVVRTRVRRLLREAFRLHQREFAKPLDLVLVARPSIAGKRYEVVERDFLCVMRQEGLLK